MTRTPRRRRKAQSDANDDTPDLPTHRYRVNTDGAIITGYMADSDNAERGSRNLRLPKGMIVELHEDEAALYQEHGVALIVIEDDADVSKEPHAVAYDAGPHE